MPADVRFIRRGVSKVYWVPTIANINAPTATEVNAGTNLTPQLAELSGFSYTNQPVAAGDWGDNFDPKVVGLDQAADSTVQIYEKRVTNNLRSVLAKGTAGNLVIFFAGLAGTTPAAGDKCDVWPCTSAGTPRDYTAADAARWHAALVPSARPAEDVALV